MAYIKKQRYKTSPLGEVQIEIEQFLKENNPELSGAKIKQLVYDPTPMTAMFWLKYFTPVEMNKYLVKTEDYDRIREEYMMTLWNQDSEIEEIEGI